MGVMKVQFSIGFCTNKGCDEFNKGVFLSHVTLEYGCHRCLKPGLARYEKQWPERYDSLDFFQVRLEYNYYAPEDRYQDICIVTDESCPKNGNVWNVQSPHSRTEKHARKTATDVLAFLQRADSAVLEPNILIRNTEFVLDFNNSKDRFKEDLDHVFSTLRRSRLCVDQKQTE